MSAFQTQALNFTIADRLGGTVERNPPFSRDATNPLYVRPDRNNLYNFEVDELGVLDLSLVPGSPTIGVRFVNWIWIASKAELTDPAQIEIVDSVSLKTMRTVAEILPGVESTLVYLDRGAEVPQGASIRFSGGAWEGLTRLRIGLVPATDNLQWAAQKIAFCCLQGGGFLPLFPPKPPD